MLYEDYKPSNQFGYPSANFSLLLEDQDIEQCVIGMSSDTRPQSTKQVESK
jgi:hypothetical protein